MSMSIIKVYEPCGENGWFHLRWRCSFLGATSFKKRPFVTTWRNFLKSIFCCRWFVGLTTVWAVDVAEYTQLRKNNTGVCGLHTQFGMVNGVWLIITHRWQTQSWFKGNLQDPERIVNLWFTETNPSQQLIETRDSNWLSWNEFVMVLNWMSWNQFVRVLN